MNFYKYLGNRKITSDVPFSWNPFTIWRGFKEIGERIKAKKLEGNYTGEGRTLGGIMVYSPDQGVVYTYKENTGAEIPTDEIIAAAKKVDKTAGKKKTGEL